MASSPTPLTAIPIDSVYFTFNRIRPRFSCGRLIEETYQQIQRNEMDYEKDLPSLLVYRDKEGRYYSMNNRRLYLFKRLSQDGLLNNAEGLVKVRLKPMPSTKRMKEKYSPAKCSLQATLKREKGVESGMDPHSEESDDNEEEEEEEESENDDDEGDNNNNKKKKKNQKNTKQDSVVPSQHTNSGAISNTQRRKQKRAEKRSGKEESVSRKGPKRLEDELNELGIL